MKILEFLKEDNGNFSSTRLFAFAIVTSVIIEWMHAIFFLGGIYHPDYGTLGLVMGVLGAKILQKKNEEKFDGIYLEGSPDDEDDKSAEKK